MPGIAVFVQQRNVFDAEVLIGQNIQARHSERVKPTGTVAQDNAVFDFQTGFVQKLLKVSDQAGMPNSPIMITGLS